MSGRRRATGGTWGIGIAVLLLTLAPTALDGQDAEVREPPMAEAPRLFRVGPVGGALLWEDAETRSPEDQGTVGLGVERLLFGFLSARVEGAYGSSTFRDAATGRSEEIDTWLFDVVVSGRVAGPLDPVTPFVSVGVGTTVFDPGDEDLVTRNQNNFQVGGGVDVQPFPRVGFRAEYRRYSVDVENLFDRVDRTGESRDAHRVSAGVFWTF